MKRVQEMTADERIELFGYDPPAGLQYIGATESSFPYFHPTLPGAKGRFEFYYNPETGDIDVNHQGCNGRIFTGKELPNGSVTFRPPRGYPNAKIFIKEFRVLRTKFLANPSKVQSP